MGTVRVRGHIRRNGTYVAPHVRTSPDGNPFNNWGSKGNANPFTGKRGRTDPFQVNIRRVRRGRR